MKKTYIKPESKVIEIDYPSALLEESEEDTWGQAKNYHWEGAKKRSSHSSGGSAKIKLVSPWEQWDD